LKSHNGVDFTAPFGMTNLCFFSSRGNTHRRG